MELAQRQADQDQHARKGHDRAIDRHSIAPRKWGPAACAAPGSQAHSLAEVQRQPIDLDHGQVGPLPRAFKQRNTQIVVR
jgi:hypothetical protein